MYLTYMVKYSLVLNQIHTNTIFLKLLTNVTKLECFTKFSVSHSALSSDADAPAVFSSLNTL